MLNEKEKKNILEIKTGDFEQSSNILSPKVVTIVGFVEKIKNKKDRVMDNLLLQVLVKHPDNDKPLALSKIKYLDEDEIKTKGLWVSLDKEGQFYKNSPIDVLLKLLNCNTLDECIGIDISTVTESKEVPYLCIRAY